MQAATKSDSRIAITGCAYRFPGDATSHESYWALLDSGRSVIRDTPVDRFDIEPYFNEDGSVPGTTYARGGGYVNGVFEFDHSFFRISRAEAMSMDPQQRWMLELCWQALESAGIAPGTVRGRSIGVFLGSGEVDYGRRTMWSGDMTRLTTYARLGTSRPVLAGRIAYFLGVHGPAVFVDTACSTSLTAVHLAAQSLRAGDCDIAIAGGINLILSPEETIAGARLQAMSHSETCRPFDAKADGYMRGEGGGVIVMKRIDDALRDDDRIDAVLAGSAINNDGPSNGLTAPNGVAQESVIRTALQRANAKPESVAYVEAHGTGTQLGDPIELGALRNVYAKDVQRNNALLVGSVKAQIGHLEAGASIAGLIKAMLVLQKRRIPAQANFLEPTPRFRWEGSQIRVPRESEALPDDDSLVGVSGFGISGTNVHVLLARAPSREPVADAGAGPHVLTLSAKTRDGCVRLAKEYRNVLSDTETALRDVCYTASVRRDHWSHRVAVVGNAKEQLVQALDDFLAANPTGTWHTSEVTPSRRLVFLFPGQGAWKPGVGAHLYNENASFHRFVDECLAHLDPALAADVFAAIRGEHPETVRHRQGQLAHFVVLHSLARTWIALGHTPDVVIGHSLGEHVAATVAGVMSLEDGLKAVEARGRLFDTATPPGAMLAVAASVAELRRLFDFGDDLFIAGINGPEQTVVSGTASAVETVLTTMTGMGRRASLLSTYDTPGHSPMLAPMRAGFAEALSKLHFRSPKIPLISTLTGKAANEAIATTEHWLDLVENPVLFSDALSQLTDQDCVFLEVGPGAALSNLARAATQKWDQHACEPNEPVLVFVSSHPSDLAGFLGVWLAGGVAVPIHRTSPAGVVDGIHDKTRARLVVDVAGSTPAGFSPVTRVSSIAPGPREQLANAALIIFTSGSTGVPKGVVVSHDAFSGKLRSIDAMIHFRRNERTLQILNITFSFGIWVSLLTLLGGGTIVLPHKFVPAHLLDQLRNEQIHRVGVVPTMLRAMLAVLAQDSTGDHGFKAACPVLRQILTGGEQLGEQLATQVSDLFPDTDLVNIYGLTETSTCDFFQFPADRQANPHSLGLPSSRVKYRVVDEVGLETAAGCIGELQIDSPFLMNGYLDEPTLTEAAFSNGWFRTGDLAVLGDDGQVALMGRSKEVISRGGNKVTPMEVERAIKQFEAVCDCMVVGAPDAILGERVHALIVPNTGFTVDLDPLRTFLATKLDRFKLPDFVYVAEALPVGRTGKADRRELRNMIAGGLLVPVASRA